MYVCTYAHTCNILYDASYVYAHARVYICVFYMFVFSRISCVNTLHVYTNTYIPNRYFFVCRLRARIVKLTWCHGSPAQRQHSCVGLTHVLKEISQFSPVSDLHMNNMHTCVCVWACTWRHVHCVHVCAICMCNCVYMHMKQEIIFCYLQYSTCVYVCVFACIHTKGQHTLASPPRYTKCTHVCMYCPRVEECFRYLLCSNMLRYYDTVKEKGVKLRWEIAWAFIPLHHTTFGVISPPRRGGALWEPQWECTRQIACSWLGWSAYNVSALHFFFQKQKIKKCQSDSPQWKTRVCNFSIADVLQGSALTVFGRRVLAHVVIRDYEGDICHDWRSRHHPKQLFWCWPQMWVETRPDTTSHTKVVVSAAIRKA